MKKILVISFEFPPTGAGAGIYIEKLVHLLGPHLQIDLVLQDDAICNLDDVNIRRIPKRTRGQLLQSIYALLKIDYQYYDFIVLNDLSSIFVFTCFVRKHFNKVIPIIHGTEPEEVFDQPRSLFKLLNFPQKYLRLIKTCYAPVFVSQDVLEKFEISSQSKITHAQKIYFGLDTSDFINDVSEIESHFPIIKNLYQNHKVLLSVSRLVKEKGYDKMFAVFKELYSLDPSWRWIIVGSGSYYDAFKTSLGEWANRITLVGKVEHSHLNYFYQNCHAFMLLSLFRESLGIVYLEAMLYGKPVYAHQYGGVSEAVQKNGSLFELQSTPELIAQNIHESKDLIPSYPSEFTNETMRTSWLGLLQ